MELSLPEAKGKEEILQGCKVSVLKKVLEVDDVTVAQQYEYT